MKKVKANVKYGFCKDKNQTSYTFRDKLELAYAYHNPHLGRSLNSLDPAERRRLLLERKESENEFLISHTGIRFAIHRTPRLVLV